jgi:hypothetical protein
MDHGAPERKFVDNVALHIKIIDFEFSKKYY